VADNTTIDPGTGGDTLRDKDRAGIKTPIIAVDLNPAGAETLMSGAMPVTDNGGTLSVDDGAGSLTVDGTVTANAGTGPFPVSDNAGSLTVDAPVGTPVFTRLSDGTAALTTTGGRLSVDASGVAVPITDNAGSLTVDNAGTFAVQDSQTIADNAGFTDGTSKIFPVGLIFDEVAGTALTENDVAAARIDAKRATVTTLEDATTRGQRAAVSAAGALKVDNSAVTQPVSGTVSITANSAVNVAQVAGTTTDTNSGVKSAGTQRVVLATDQPQLTNALKVDGSAVTQPVSGTVGITANSSVNVAQVAGTTTDTNSGVKSAGTQRMVLATDQPALTNALKVDGSAVTQPVSGSVTATLAAGTAVAAKVGLDPATHTGWDMSKTISAATTNATVVKASAGKLGGWFLSNVNAAARYLKVYNKATSPTVGTDVPVLTILIPGNTAGAGANLELSNGLLFSTGISFAVTTGITDADSTAVAANEIAVNLYYK
jgi:plasmid maintenance system antidote protein VapI